MFSCVFRFSKASFCALRSSFGQHSLTSVERPLYLRSDFVNVWRHARLVLLLRSYTDLSDDLTVCSHVLSWFFDNPSIDSNKKMSLSPFKGCFEVSSLFFLRGVLKGPVSRCYWITSFEWPQITRLGDNYTLSLSLLNTCTL